MAAWGAPTRAPAGVLRAAALAGALAGGLFAAAAAQPGPAAAASQPNLTFVSSTTWTADPADAVVHVVVDITATSHAATTDGRSGFYTTLEMTLPPTATDVTASAIDGSARKVTTQGRNSSGIAVSIALGRRLYSRDSTSVVLSFDLVDAGGSTDRDLRIGRNLMSFPVSAFGSPGTPGSSVTVIFPSDFSVQEEFGTLTRTILTSGETVFSSGPLDDATSLSAWFTATQPVPESDFLTRTLTIGALSVSLRYWADDPGWANAVASVLITGVPLLEQMIGLGDPANRDLTVTEASSQEIGGFSGTFDETTGQVEVSYLADPFVIMHEAAHMWFNETLASDRWIDEGFASYYAEQAVEKMHLVDHSPQLSDRLRQAAIPFDDWVTSGVPNSATDAYLYAATLTVAGEIADLAGQSGLQMVWREAWAGTAAYQPVEGLSRESQPGPIDWRRFLDLLELSTGKSFEALWSEWVVTPTQAPLLNQRLAAQATYRQVLSIANDWTLPAQVRRDLDTWQFDQAQSDLSQVRTVLAVRQQISDYSAREQTSPPPTLRQVFETSTVGAASSEAQAEVRALDALADAARAKADSEQNGSLLIGKDPDADLDAARQAFAQGNLGSAVRLAQSAEATWQGGYSAGLVRIAGLVVGSLGLVMLAATGLWLYVSRRRAAGLVGQPVSSGAVALALPAEFETLPDRQAAAGRDEDGRFGGLAAGREGGTLYRVPILASARRDESGSDGGAKKGVGDGRADGDGEEAGAGGGEVSGGDGAGGGSLEGGSVDGGAEGDLEAEPTLDDEREANPFGAGFGEPVDREQSAYDLLRRGTALLRDRHNAQAAVVLERAARVAPGKGSILEALGRAYFNSGQHSRAAEAFEALLEVDPSAHYGHFGLGLSFDRLGRNQDARKHLRLAVALHPTSETYRQALEKVESKGRS